MWQYRWGIWPFLFLGVLVIETSLLPHVFPMGYVPDMMIPMVVALALYETPLRGAALGALGGLMVDVAAGRLFGLNMAIDAGVGFLVATIQTQIVRDDIFVPGLLGALFETISRLLIWVIIVLLGFPVGFQSFMAALPSSILFALFMTPAIIGILHLRPRHEVDPSLKF